MSYCKIAWRNMQQRALASSLTGLSMALGVALMVLVLVIHEVVVAQLSNDAQGYNFIVGGKGSPYEIVLTTVFHVGKPLYPIPWKYYQKFVDGEFAPYTDVAVPICLGDSYPTEDGQLFRVVGTTPDMFDKLAYGADDEGNEKRYEFSSGRNFKPKPLLRGGDRLRRRESHRPESRRPVSAVARHQRRRGQARRFRSRRHPRADRHGERPCAVREHRRLLLARRSRPGAEAGAEPEPPIVVARRTSPGSRRRCRMSQREVTSILVRCNPEEMMAPMQIDMGVNKGDDLTAQAVAPVSVVERLQASFLAPMRLILLVLTVLIVIVAGISILVSIYNSMSERSHDIAVMRALGASRTAVMAVILVESILLSLLGGLAGLLLGHGVLALASPVVEYYTGITVRAWQLHLARDAAGAGAGGVCGAGRLPARPVGLPHRRGQNPRRSTIVTVNHSI